MLRQHDPRFLVTIMGEEARQKYYRRLDTEIEDPQAFKQRVLRALNNHGNDITPEGQLIKAEFWEFVRSRVSAALECADEDARRKLVGSALAGEDLIRQVVLMASPGQSRIWMQIKQG